MRLPNLVAAKNLPSPYFLSQFVISMKYTPLTAVIIRPFILESFFSLKKKKSAIHIT